MKSNTQSKIVSQSIAADIAKKWKTSGEAIIFTNGCFDILHKGHVDYLEKAKNLGDRLILGLNTDASVSRIKGPTRPIVDEEARARVMASLAFIDLVVLFDEPTPYELIKLISPSVLVKGNDYLAENIVGADLVKNAGGRVETIELVKGYSTTTIVNKIKSLTL